MTLIAITGLRTGAAGTEDGHLMIELICTEPNPPAALKLGGCYECLDSRVTSEGEAQVRVIARAAATPQVPHHIWWPVDLFKLVSDFEPEDLAEYMARINTALMGLQKSLVPEAAWSTVSQFADPEDGGELTTSKPFG